MPLFGKVSIFYPQRKRRRRERAKKETHFQLIRIEKRLHTFFFICALLLLLLFVQQNIFQFRDEFSTLPQIFASVFHFISFSFYLYMDMYKLYVSLPGTHSWVWKSNAKNKNGNYIKLRHSRVRIHTLISPAHDMVPSNRVTHAWIFLIYFSFFGVQYKLHTTLTHTERDKIYKSRQSLISSWTRL